MNGQHDKHLLILVYKLFFLEKYPTTEYRILFEPRMKLASPPAYRADILILRGTGITLDNIMLWVEVGNLESEKAQYITTLLGKNRLRHINYGHPVFDIFEPLEKELAIEGYRDFRERVQQREKKLIEQEISACGGNLWKTAERMNLTYRQLRYRIEKYGIQKRQGNINQ